MRYIVFGIEVLTLKKLLAIVLAFFTSLFNSLEFQISDDKVYSESAYYTISEDDEPDYREFYGSINAGADTSGCKTTNYNAQGKLVDMAGTTVMYEGYWLENGTYKNINDISDQEQGYTFNSESYIIIPYDGVLQSDSTNNNGTTMTIFCSVGDVTYRLSISGMQCWYCDIGRHYSSDDNTFHTSENQKGKSFKAGNVIGLSTAGTSISIAPIKNGKVVGTCTLQQMYMGTYTPSS